MKYNDESAKVDFADPEPDLTVDFTAPSLGVKGTPAEEFEAVVYAVKKYEKNGKPKYKCDYNTILGYTDGADLTSPSDDPDIKNFLTVSVDDSAAPTYTVEVSELDENLSDIPSYYYDDYEANLYVCIELQQHGCGRKQEFADVLLHISINLKSECKTCPIAYIKREGPEKDDAEVCAPELVCYLGPDTPGKEPEYGTTPIFYQGDEIQACIKYNETSLCDSEICFKRVVTFDATIYEYDRCQGQCEEENALSGDDLLALTGNPFTQVGESDCTSDPLEAGLTECCVTFIPDQKLIQALRKKQKLLLGIAAQVHGTYDCYTEPPCESATGSCPDSRFLQGSEVPEDEPIATIFKDFVLDPTEDSEPAPAADDCDGFFLVCWIEAFFAFLGRLFGF